MARAKAEAKLAPEMVVVQWTNKLSGEQGFVKCIRKREREFENTFEKSEAKQYKPQGVAAVLRQLAEFCEQNTYEAVAAV